MFPAKHTQCRPLAGLLLASVLVADLPPAEASGSRYERTLRALQQAEPEWRSDFAGIALWQLSGAYYAEAELARQDVHKKPQWSSSVVQYASRLSVFQRRVEEGAAVSFELSPVTEAVVQVDGEQVMLAHPRPGRQEAYEESVLEHFCRLRDCPSLTGSMAPGAGAHVADRADTAIAVMDEPPASDAGRARVAGGGLKTGWEFTAEATVCSYDGVRLRFREGDNAGAVRKLCRDLFVEIAALRDGLRQQQQYGVVIDWREVSFRGTATDAGEPLLRLNRDGDLLRLDVPLLRAHPAVLHSLMPWLSAQASGQGAVLELQAAVYGWQGAALDRYR